MDEITLDDQTYVSSKRAAQITGYAKDYVGQLCREGRVEARLVGRNWYVLESSIREHRFGAHPSSAPKSNPSGEAEESSASTEPSWTTSYTSVSLPEVLPTIVRPVSVENVPVSKPVDSEVVKDMQSAWHDWFTKTNELEVSKEILLENSDVRDLYSNEAVEDVPVTLTHQEIVENASIYPAQTVFETETTPVTLEKVAEAIEKRTHVDPEVESVQINRTYVPPVTYTKVPAQSLQMPSRDIPATEASGKVIRERRVVRRTKPSGLLQTVFILIGIVALAITALNSGYADSFLSQHNVNIRFINYLGGTRSIQK